MIHESRYQQFRTTSCRYKSQFRSIQSGEVVFKGLDDAVLLREWGRGI